MSHDAPHDNSGESGSALFSKTLMTLERMDNIAHIVVAAMFILMAATVIVYSSAIFLRELPLIGAAFHSQSAERPTSAEQQGGEVPAGRPVSLEQPAGAAVGDHTARTGQPAHAGLPEHGVAPEHTAGSDPFFHSSLELLSSILFVVIVLELLKTIITYLQTRDIHAIMKEFLVVGIISSVRKILLVGAESSLAGDKGWEFIKEAGGTVISIIGILLLIYGLVLLQRSHTDRANINVEANAT